MEYFVAFENGQLILNQKIEGRTVSANVDIKLVPKINKVLEKHDLPTLFQWVSYGLDLLPIMKIMLATGAVQLFTEGDRFYDQAHKLLDEASLALTGEKALAKEMTEIIATVIIGKTKEEIEQATEEVRQQWPHLYYQLSDDE